MNIISKIGLNKTISVVIAIAMLGSAGFSLYQGSQAYAQEDNTVQFPVDSQKY